MPSTDPTTMRTAHLGRRLCMLVAGIELATLGITLTTLSGLGTTPISSLPWVLSNILPLTFGTTTFIVNLLFLLMQLLLLRRRFPPANLLQLPNVLVFSAFIDFNMKLLGPYAPSGWTGGLLASLLGNLVLAVGIVLQVRSKTIVQPGEGLVVALAAVSRRPFGTMKIFNDVTLVALSAVLSWSVLGGVVGIREGTLLSAVLVGLFVKAIGRILPAGGREGPHELGRTEGSGRSTTPADE